MFSPSVIDAIKTHAIRDYPRESVGIVVGDGYIPMENKAKDPLHGFDCTLESAPYFARGEVMAVVHSHPDGPIGPTRHDMMQQIASKVPWGITVCDQGSAMDPYFWGEHITAPIMNREFRHGPSGTDGRGDCYALIKDWYRVRLGIELPEQPRDDNWWVQGRGNLYEDNFASAGFREVDKTTPQKGDVVLMRYPGGTPVANHAAIYIGNGEILHHIANRLSRIDSMIRFQRFVVRWLRYG